MAPHDPKIAAVFEAIREAVARVADDEIIPRLESLERERADDSAAALGQALEHERAVRADAVASAVRAAQDASDARQAALREQLQAEAEALATARRAAQAAESAAADARAHIESLTSQVQYLQSRLSDLDQTWRAAIAERDTLAAQSAAGLLRLLAALRPFRSCMTLTQCLDALSSALALVTPRGAVLLPRGDVWLVWSTPGFAADDRFTNKTPMAAPVPTAAFADWLPATDGASDGPPVDGLMPLAVSTRMWEQGRAEAWPFVTPAPREDGACWPVLIEGVVTVVVYADRDSLPDDVDPRREIWEALVGGLVHYAQKAIESVTAGQLLRSAGVVVSRGTARASA